MAHRQRRRRRGWSGRPARSTSHWKVGYLNLLGPPRGPARDRPDCTPHTEGGRFASARIGPDLLGPLRRPCQTARATRAMALLASGTSGSQRGYSARCSSVGWFGRYTLGPSLPDTSAGAACKTGRPFTERWRPSQPVPKSHRFARSARSGRSAGPPAALAGTVESLRPCLRSPVRRQPGRRGMSASGRIPP